MSTKKGLFRAAAANDVAIGSVNPVYIGCDLHGTLIRPDLSVNSSVMNFLLASHRAGHVVHVFDLSEEAANPRDAERISERIYRGLEKAGLSAFDQAKILDAGVFKPKPCSDLFAGGYTLVIDDDRVMLGNFDGAHHADPDTRVFTAFCDNFARNPRQDLDVLAGQYFVQISAREPDYGRPEGVVDQLGQVFGQFFGGQDPEIA